MRLEQVRLVVGLLMALDALVILAAPGFWQRQLPGVRLARLARLEAIAALILLALHWLDPG